MKRQVNELIDENKILREQIYFLEAINDLNQQTISKTLATNNKLISYFIHQKQKLRARSAS